jgi:hypothetical protein
MGVLRPSQVVLSARKMQPAVSLLVGKVALMLDSAGGNTVMAEPVHLTLYVTRACAIQATKNLMKVLGVTKEDVADLKIIDVTTHAHVAEEDNVVDIPCLKVERGDDEFMVVGDLSDLDRIEQAIKGVRTH